MILNIFSYTMGCFFILLIIFFDAQKLLVLTKYYLFIYLGFLCFW